MIGLPADEGLGVLGAVGGQSAACCVQLANRRRHMHILFWPLARAELLIEFHSSPPHKPDLKMLVTFQSLKGGMLLD